MEDEYEDYRKTLKEAEEIKKALNLESIDTALLMMIQQDTDLLRFHNTD